MSAIGSFDPGQEITSYARNLDADGQFDDAAPATTTVFRADYGDFVVARRF